MLAPLLNPITPDVPIVGVVTDEVPVNIDHIPKPIEGLFPVKLVVGVQIVWSSPAFAGVGNGFT